MEVELNLYNVIITYSQTKYENLNQKLGFTTQATSHKRALFNMLCDSNIFNEDCKDLKNELVITVSKIEKK